MVVYFVQLSGTLLLLHDAEVIGGELWHCLHAIAFISKYTPLWTFQSVQQNITKRITTTKAIQKCKVTTSYKH